MTSKVGEIGFAEVEIEFGWSDPSDRSIAIVSSSSQDCLEWTPKIETGE